MVKEPFVDRYLDVLQNIEAGIVMVYRRHPEMTDWQALSAVEALIRGYQAEARGRSFVPPSLDPLAQEVYDVVRVMCEWRLGRGAEFVDEEGHTVEIAPEPISLDEIVACLKRIRRSINRWTKERGRRGYLTFIEPYIP